MPEINYAAAEEHLPDYLAVPDSLGTWPGVVIVQDVLGMTADLRRITDRFAASGYLALAPALYGGSGSTIRCVISTILAHFSGHGAAYDGLIAAREHLIVDERCTGKVGLVGFCMGAGFVLQLAPWGLFDAAAPNYGMLPVKSGDLDRLPCVVTQSRRRVISCRKVQIGSVVMVNRGPTVARFALAPQVRQTQAGVDAHGHVTACRQHEISQDLTQYAPSGARPAASIAAEFGQRTQLMSLASHLIGTARSWRPDAGPRCCTNRCLLGSTERRGGRRCMPLKLRPPRARTRTRHRRADPPQHSGDGARRFSPPYEAPRVWAIAHAYSRFHSRQRDAGSPGGCTTKKSAPDRTHPARDGDAVITAAEGDAAIADELSQLAAG